MATNLSKASQVCQGSEDTRNISSEVGRSLLDLIPLDLDAQENCSTVSLAFVNHSVPDIHCKLQKLQDFKGKRLAELLAVAEKVFNNRETPEDRHTEGLLEALKIQILGLIKVLLTASGSPGVRRQVLASGDSPGTGKGL